MQRPRAGSALDLRGPSPEPAAEPQLGGSPAAMGVTAPAGSPPARSRLKSVASTAERRRSVVVLAPPEAPERGSALPGTAASGASSGHKADGPHPGLTRLTSFMRRKSTLRGKMSSIQELSAAMDSLDQRIVGALEQLRQQNAAGAWGAERKLDGACAPVQHASAGPTQVAARRLLQGWATSVRCTAPRAAGWHPPAAAPAKKLRPASAHALCWAERSTTPPCCSGSNSMRTSSRFGHLA